MAVEAGADFLGLNFWPEGKRYCSIDVAKRIVAELGGQISTVAVFVDADEAQIASMRQDIGFEWVQLHGQEAPECVHRFLPKAFKALRVQDASSVENHRAYPGELILLDAYSAQMPGGSGKTFDWTLAKEVAKERKLMLAGGLRPDNVAKAVQTLRPYAVDVASGVERITGKKDPELVKAFVSEAKKVDG